MINEVREHPSITNHWFVGDILVAGAVSAEEAVALLEAVRNRPATEPVPAPTADDIRTEAQRRLMILLSARDPAHLKILILNNSREAIRLLRKGETNWTAEETERAKLLEQLDSAIEAIRAASNRLEIEPPVDYREDAYWPPKIID